MSTPWHDQYGYYQQPGGPGGALDETSHSELDHAGVLGVPDADGDWTAGAGVMSSWNTNAAIGNGTVTHRYCQIGKYVHVAMIIIAGSTTTWGTGGGLINNFYPVAAASAGHFLIPSVTTNAAATTILVGVPNGSGIVIVATNGAGAQGAPGAGTTITIQCTYEAA